MNLYLEWLTKHIRVRKSARSTKRWQANAVQTQTSDAYDLPRSASDQRLERLRFMTYGLDLVPCCTIFITLYRQMLNHKARYHNLPKVEIC